MADEATEPKSAETEEKTEAKAEETPQGEPDWKALARKWEKRAKANAKELEDVKASQTDDAQARTADELAKAREEIKQLKASQERERTARTIARASGVDPEILIRMHGDTEAEIKENAELLAKSSKAKWPNVPDDGDSRGSKRMTREQILAIKDQGKRVEEIARNLDLFR